MTITKEIKALVSIQAAVEEVILPNEDTMASQRNKNIHYGVFDVSRAEFYYEELVKKIETLNLIYRLAHIASPHDCEHRDWEIELESTFEHLADPKVNYISKDDLLEALKK